MTLLPYTLAHARRFGVTENSQPVLLPEKPEPVLLAKILNQVTSLGRIHLSQPSFRFA